MTGLGLVTPLGTTAEETWGGFLRGESGIRRIDLFDSGRYPSALGAQVDHAALRRFFNGHGRKLDAASVLILSAVRDALDQSGLEDHDHEKTTLTLGSTLGGMNAATAYIREVRKRGFTRARASGLRQMLAQSHASDICDAWNLGGESLVISDACTSGTNSLGYAARLIRGGDTDIAVAGGYDPMAEFSFAGFHSLMAISPDQVRPFDENRQGLMLGEGAAVFILESGDHARKRGAEILGRIAGYGESADGYHITRPDPNGRGAALALRRALDDARVQPEDIGHINAHGTGTPSNDPMEAAAICSVFGDHARSIPITSNKAAIGHTLGAAGAIEAGVTLMALRDQVIPQTLNHESLDPKCEGIDVVAGEPRTTNMKYAVSNSFGFGGSNAALVLTVA